jgi:hypothetical protein
MSARDTSLRLAADDLPQVVYKQGRGREGIPALTTVSPVKAMTSGEDTCAALVLIRFESWAMPRVWAAFCILENELS